MDAKSTFFLLEPLSVFKTDKLKCKINREKKVLELKRNIIIVTWFEKYICKLIKS